MYKIAIRSILTLIIILLCLIVYLSTLGIKTSFFNKLILEKITEIDQRINLELEEVYLKLNLSSKEVIINTNNSIINIENNLITLSKIDLKLDLFSVLNSNQILKKIELEIKENSIKNVINFANAYRLNLPLFFAQNQIEKGSVKANLILVK